MPARPSPPGRNGSVEEKETDSARNEAGEQASGDSVPAAATDNAPVPAAPATPTANTAFLSAAISRANALVSSVAGSNLKRRESLGIRSTNNNGNQNNQTEGQTETLGLPPRSVIQTETQMDADLAEELDSTTADGVKSPVDPPVVDSAPIKYAATLQKFREAGGAISNPEIKVEDNSDDYDAATVSGEHTSEVGENEENKVSANEYVEDRKPSSFLKRGCFAILKLIMFVQMSCGIIYLAYNYAPTCTLYNWNDYSIPSIPIHVKATIGKFASWRPYYGTGAPDELSQTEMEATEEVSPCFINHPNWDTSDEDLDNDHYVCETNYKQCPPWGRCHAGKLLDCTDGGGLFDMYRFVPNEKEDGCVPSPEANVFVKVVQDVLVGMTTAQTCRSSDRIKEPEAVLLEDPFPLFSLEKVVEKVREALGLENAGIMSPVFLLWLYPVFDSDLVRFGSLSGDSGDDLDAMGLGSGISPSSLSLPLDCTMKLLLWELLEYFGHSTLALVTFSFKKVWFLVNNYPLYTFGALALWKLAEMIQRKRKHRAKVLELFGIVLQAVYDRLSECEDHEGYAGLLLRDDVGHDMYPTSFRERQFVNDFVWPRVALEILADNRVRKFHRVANGKQLEHWDFAIQSKRGWKLRKSMGTPDSKVKGDVTPIKREP